MTPAHQRFVTKAHLSITNDDMKYRGEGALGRVLEPLLKDRDTLMTTDQKLTELRDAVNTFIKHPYFCYDGVFKIPVEDMNALGAALSKSI